METISLLLILLVCGLPFLIIVQCKNLRKLIREGVALQTELHTVIRKRACGQDMLLNKEEYRQSR